MQIAHVLEETADPAKGVEFLTSTRNDWTGPFQCHITWHLTLYYLGRLQYIAWKNYIGLSFYLDLGDTESMFREFDNVIFENATNENWFGLLDASSLLWRLNCLGIDAGEKRWQRVVDGVTKQVDNDSNRSPW